MIRFVRHATVELRLDEPSSRWELDGAGRRAAEAVARRLAPVPRVLSSPEPKAIATAAPLADASGVEVEVDERLREVERASNLADHDQHRAAVRSYLDGEAVEGWERSEDALARFRAAVAGVDDAAVVTHATVLSLFLGYGVEEWERIGLPDVIQWQP